MSALARRGREEPADLDALDQAKVVLRTDLPRFLIVVVSQNLVEQTGKFADTFALCGYDSVQLVNAYLMQQRVKQPVFLGVSISGSAKPPKYWGWLC